MSNLWQAIILYQAFIAKSGLVEVFRENVRKIALIGAETAVRKIVTKADQKAKGGQRK